MHKAKNKTNKLILVITEERCVFVIHVHVGWLAIIRIYDGQDHLILQLLSVLITPFPKAEAEIEVIYRRFLFGFSQLSGSSRGKKAFYCFLLRHLRVLTMS